MGESRREFLKKGAAAGTLVWAAPSIATLPGGRAWAQTYPRDCPCTADAFGLRVIIPPLGINETFGVGGCVADVNVGVAGTATVTSATVCGEADSDGSDGACSANASIETLNVVVGPPLAPTLTVAASVLTSEATAQCDPCNNTGTSTIASLVVNGITVTALSECNNDVLGLGLITLNEQTCAGDTLSVNALHITVSGIIEVIVAHSEAGGVGCCTPCA